SSTDPLALGQGAHALARRADSGAADGGSRALDPPRRRGGPRLRRTRTLETGALVMKPFHRTWPLFALCACLWTLSAEGAVEKKGGWPSGEIVSLTLTDVPRSEA